jgi:hypothetical protein
MPSVDELRDEIRVAVGRYERRESTAFTKEALAAICEALDAPVGDGRLPPKAEMRATIRERVGRNADEGAFRKADLEVIAAALTSD